MATENFKPMIKWATDPADIAPEITTAGRDAGAATRRALEAGGPFYGLGAVAYAPKSGARGRSTEQGFSGDHGTYTSGTDHRVFHPGTTSTGGKPVQR